MKHAGMCFPCVFTGCVPHGPAREKGAPFKTEFEL